MRTSAEGAGVGQGGSAGGAEYPEMDAELAAEIEQQKKWLDNAVELHQSTSPSKRAQAAARSHAPSESPTSKFEHTQVRGVSGAAAAAAAASAYAAAGGRRCRCRCFALQFNRNNRNTNTIVLFWSIVLFRFDSIQFRARAHVSTPSAALFSPPIVRPPPSPSRVCPALRAFRRRSSPRQQIASYGSTRSSPR